MDSGGAHERLVVGVAADDFVEDDDVGGPDLVTVSGEIEQVALDPSLEPRCLEELGGIRLVGG